MLKKTFVLLALASLYLGAECTQGSLAKSCSSGNHIWCCQNKAQCAVVDGDGNVLNYYTKESDSTKPGARLTPSPLNTARIECNELGE